MAQKDDPSIDIANCGGEDGLGSPIREAYSSVATATASMALLHMNLASM